MMTDAAMSTDASATPGARAIAPQASPGEQAPRRVSFYVEDESDSDSSSGFTAPSERLVTSSRRPTQSPTSSESLLSLAKVRPLELPPPPAHLVCPIGRELMADPVLAADGVAYDREHIVSYFARGGRTSPSTGQPLPSFKLRAEPQLAAAAAAHKALRAEITRQWSEMEVGMRRYMGDVARRMEQGEAQVRELQLKVQALQQCGQGRSGRSKESGRLSAASTAADSLSPQTVPSLMSNAARATRDHGCAFNAGPAPRSARGDRASPRPGAPAAPREAPRAAAPALAPGLAALTPRLRSAAAALTPRLAFGRAPRA